MDKNLDRILSRDQDVIPSTHFVSNVMVAVRREASIPAPISFPWRHVVPGLGICVAALTCLMVVAVAQCCEALAGTGPVPIIVFDVVGIANRVELGWISLALVASFVPTKLLLARLYHP